jgi:hypothetical protein
LRDYKLSIIACGVLGFVFLALLLTFRNSFQHRIVVHAGPDQVIRADSTRMQGSVLNQRPLSFWTGDGDHATEDMLVKYNSQSGASYVGPLRNPDGIHFGWPSDFARIGKVIYGVDADRRRLYKLNGDTGICEPLETRIPYQRVFGLAYDQTHQKLYAVDQVSRKLLLLDTLTGKASEVLTLPDLHTDVRGLAYSLLDDKLYYSDESTESIYSCDPQGGTPQLIMSFQDGPQARIEELEYYDGRLFASYLTQWESIWIMQVLEIDTKQRTKHPIGPVIKDLSGHCLLINSMPERIYWKQISGPAKALFSDIANPRAIVKFPRAGKYVLELGAAGNSDTVTLTAERTRSGCRPK